MLSPAQRKSVSQSVWLAVLLLSTAALGASAAQLLETQIEQVRFFKTTEQPEVKQESDGWRIVLRGGEISADGQGVYLSPDVSSNYITYMKWDAASKQWSWPPTSARPDDNNGYLIIGEPGDRFRVTIDTDELPIFEDVEIEGAAPPIDPPVDDYSELTEISKNAADALNDPTTRASLKTAMSSVNYEGSTLAEAQQLVVSAVLKVMSDRRDSSVDANWYNGWRVPINEALAASSIETVDQYKAAIEAIVKGL